LRGSSSSTSPSPRVRVPRHVTRLVVDYFDYTARLGASARRATRHTTRRRLLRVTWLVVDYFDYTAHPVALARRAACHRLLHLRRASRCLGTSRNSSHGSSSTTSTTPRVRVPRHLAQLVTRLVAPLVVDYFDYAARPGASVRRAARHAAHRAARHVAHCTARHRLLRLCCVSWCHGTSRGSLSTSSPTPHVQVPRHVARLAVDYFAYSAHPGASARRVAWHVARCRLLRAPQLRLVATLALLQPRRALRLLVSRQHWLYFEYATRRRDVVFWSHCVDHSSRLVFQTS
jgi:hypothetical protein